MIVQCEFMWRKQWKIVEIFPKSTCSSHKLKVRKMLSAPCGRVGRESFGDFVMNLAKVFAAAAVAGGSLVASAQAATITVFTDRTAWELALAGQTIVTEDFEGVATGTLPGGGVETTLGSLGFSYLGGPDGAEPEVVDGGAVNGSRELNGEVNFDGTPSGDHTINFLGAFATAFGGDWDSTLSGSELVIEVAGETILFSDFLAPSGDGFLGFISDMAFDSFLITVAGTGAPGVSSEVFSLDDASFALVSDVPLPAALPMFLAGLAALRFGRRRAA